MSSNSQRLNSYTTGSHPFQKSWQLVSEILSAVAIVSGLSIAGATVLGAAWTAVGWLRFYGIELGVLPQALPVAPHDYNNALLSFLGQALDSYNCTFQGNSRFGSGLGIIAGASIALLLIPPDKRIGRRAGTLVAGALVGGRLALTFTSDPAPFLISALMSACIFLVVEHCTRQRLPQLPEVDHWKAMK